MTNALGYIVSACPFAKAHFVASCFLFPLIQCSCMLVGGNGRNRKQPTRVLESDNISIFLVATQTQIAIQSLSMRAFCWYPTLPGCAAFFSSAEKRVVQCPAKEKVVQMFAFSWSLWSRRLSEWLATAVEKDLLGFFAVAATSNAHFLHCAPTKCPFPEVSLFPMVLSWCLPFHQQLHR